MIDALKLNNEEHSPHHHLMKLLALKGISYRGGRKAFTFISPQQKTILLKPLSCLKIQLTPAPTLKFNELS